MSTRSRRRSTIPWLTPDHDPWQGAGRVVQVRPHVARWLSRRVRDGGLLEIGPGVRPTMPIGRSDFVDRSPHALALLAEAGGRVHLSEGELPFDDASMGAVAAFEVIEHVEGDDDVLAGIARVLRPGGILLLSVPAFGAKWSPLDDACGHVRRYDPEDLFARLAAHGLEVGGYRWTPGAPRFVYAFRAWTLHLARPLVAKVGQAVVFPLVAAWDRRFATLEWIDPAEPVPAKAEHIMVWARRRATAPADG